MTARRFSLLLPLLAAGLSACGSMKKASVSETDTAEPSITAAPTKAPVVSGDGVFVIDLPTALRLAGADNLDIRIREADSRAANARYKGALLGLLPDLSAGASIVKQDGTIQDVAGAPLDVRRVSDTVGFGTGASGAGVYPVPGAGIRFHLGDAVFGSLAARQDRNAAQAAVSTERNRVLADVAAAYYELVRTKAAVSIAADVESANEQLVDATGAFAESGEGLQSDAEGARANLLLQQRNKSRAANAYRQAAIRLTQLLHLPRDSKLVPQDSIARPIDLTDGEGSGDLVADALQHRPEMARYRAEVDAAVQRVRQAKTAPFIPSIGATYSAGDFGAGTGNAVDDRAGRSEITALIYWKLEGLGFGNAAQAEAQSALLEKTRLQESRLIDSITAEVQSAQSDIQALRSEIEISRNASGHARKAYSLTAARLKENQGLPIESMEAIRTLAQTRLAEIDSVIDQNIAQYRLLSAIGGL